MGALSRKKRHGWMIEVMEVCRMHSMIEMPKVRMWVHGRMEWHSVWVASIVRMWWDGSGERVIRIMALTEVFLTMHMREGLSVSPFLCPSCSVCGLLDRVLCLCHSAASCRVTGSRDTHGPNWSVRLERGGLCLGRSDLDHFPFTHGAYLSIYLIFGHPNQHFTNECHVVVEYHTGLLITAIDRLNSASKYVSLDTGTPCLHLTSSTVQDEAIVCVEPDRNIFPPREQCRRVRWAAHTEGYIATLTWVKDFHFKRVPRAQGVKGVLRAHCAYTLRPSLPCVHEDPILLVLQVRGHDLPDIQEIHFGRCVRLGYFREHYLNALSIAHHAKATIKSSLRHPGSHPAYCLIIAVEYYYHLLRTTIHWVDRTPHGVPLLAGVVSGPLVLTAVEQAAIVSMVTH